MKGFIQDGDVIPLTAPSGGVVSGTGFMTGAIIAIACSTVAAGLTVEAAVEGVFDHASDTGTAWAEGDKLYWDNTNKVFTKTASGNTIAGVAVAAKLSATTTGRIKLTPQY
jgi:predicted RecA/RadA family phage recombinase